MIRDERRMTLSFDTPPADSKQASERIQLMFEDPKRVETLRKASSAPPESDEEASERIHAAGPYPTNLAGTKWNTIEEFVKKLKEHGWVVEAKHLKKYSLAYPRLYEVSIKSPNHGTLFTVVSHTENGATQVLTAKVDYSTNEEWKEEVNEQ